MTDYPDRALVENMAYNVAQNVEPAAAQQQRGRRDGAVGVMGYVWGHPVEPLLAMLEDADTEAERGAGGKAFDLIILSDLIFNHSQVRTPLCVFSSLK
jgi:nicotinamide N-methyltransferase